MHQSDLHCSEFFTIYVPIRGNMGSWRRRGEGKAKMYLGSKVVDKLASSGRRQRETINIQYRIRVTSSGIDSTCGK